MSDPFIGVRETVRALQRRLKEHEQNLHEFELADRAAAALDPGHRPSPYIGLARSNIRDIEQQIVHFRMRMPPYLVEDLGVYIVKPVDGAIDPREEV